MLKSKIALFVVCVGVCAFLFSSCFRREIKNVNSHGKNIICFGDSITFGYGVASEFAYPVVMAKMISRPVINSGIDGDTSTEALSRVESDVLSQDPYLVIIEFGGNDFLRKVPLETTLSNIREMVRRIQAKGAMVALTDISAGLLMREFRPEYWKIAKEEGAIFIPSIMSGIITNPKLKSDFFHPNAAGYKLIAERVFRVIKPYLR